MNANGHGEGERSERIFDSYRSTQSTVFLRNLKVGQGLESGGGSDDGDNDEYSLRHIQCAPRDFHLSLNLFTYQVGSIQWIILEPKLTLFYYL